MKKAVISFLIVVCLCITMFPGVRVFAAQFEKEIYSDNGISVVYCVDNAWEGAFNAHITIKNNSDSTIENWCARFSYDAEITNIWNGVIEGSESGEYYVKNALWNADIKSGDIVSFGFTVNGVSDIEPINFCFEGKDYFEDESCEVNFKINSDWQSGFSGEIVISNNGDNVIEDWTIEFDLDRVIAP